MPRPAVLSRSSLALDNLRAVVILIVLAFHSILAYVEWTPATSAGFDDPPMRGALFRLWTATAGSASTCRVLGRTCT